MNILDFYKNIFGRFYSEKINKKIFDYVKKNVDLNSSNIFCFKVNYNYYKDIIMSLLFNKLSVNDNVKFIDFYDIINLFFNNDLEFFSSFDDYNYLIIYELGRVKNELFKDNILLKIILDRDLKNLKTILLIDLFNRNDVCDVDCKYYDLRNIFSNNERF